MFKRSRKKIILAIMGSLVLLFAITLSVIMLASYREIRQENMAMLKRHVELYYLDSETGGPVVPPDAPPEAFMMSSVCSVISKRVFSSSIISSWSSA